MGRAWVLGLLLLGAAGCRRGEGQEPPAPPPVVALGAENVARAEEGVVRTGPTLEGRLQPERAATVRAELAGAVLETLVAQGQQVQQGQLLARIAPAASPAQLKAAQAAVESARAGVRVAQANERRIQRLVAAGAVARQELERVQSQREAAVAQLSQAQAQAAAAREQLGRTHVYAPFPGVVSERPVSVGDIVQPGAPLFVVVDPRSLRLEASVPVQQREALAVGTPVTFTVAGFGARRFTGRVERINPVVDPATGQVRVYVALPNPDAALLGGLYAEGRVQAQALQGLTVPQDAVDRTTPSPTVVRVQQGVLQRVPVQVGLSDEVAERVLVQGPLRPGDVVLTGSARDLPEGTRVRLPPAPARPPAQGTGGAGTPP